MIISRYLFREILHTLLALTALLVLIYLSHRFMAYLVQAAAGNIPTDLILKLLVLKLLSDLMLILPLGFFLAILLTLGRLYKDNEITAMAACGIPVPFTSIVWLGGIFAVFIGILSLLVAPWAQTQKAALLAQVGSAVELGGIAAGRFKDFRQGNGIFYVETIDPGTHQMTTIFAQANLPDKQIVLVAKQGYQATREGELFMVLVDGYRYEHKPNSLNYVMTAFAEHSIRIPQHHNTPLNEVRAAVPTGLLWGMPNLSYQAELQWRLSLPLSTILLAALAVPLSRTTPRQGQYAKILLGILICLIYNNALNIAQKWVERGTVSAWVGVWWVHLSLLLIIIVLVYLPILRNWRYLLRTATNSVHRSSKS